MPALGQMGKWLLQNRISAAPTALVGLAGAATVGFMSSGGQAEGLTAGMGGAIGGGAAGGFSGAMLGIGAGAGLIATGMYSSTMRPAVGRWIGKMLSSSPMQKMATMVTSAPMGPGAAPAQRALGTFMRQEFLTPQGQAASFLITMLENKQMSYKMAMGIGGVGGALVGGTGGFGVGAWRGGSQLRGPMNQTY